MAPAESPEPAPSLTARRTAFLIVLVAMTISVLIMVWVGFRVGATALSLTLLGAGTARMLLPPHYSLGLIVRSRRVDTATLFAFGIAVLASAWSVPGH